MTRIFIRNFATKVKIDLNKPVKEKFNLRLCPSVAEEIESDNVKARRHPGVMSIGYVKLPEKLTEAALKILEGYPEKSISADATKICKYLYSRHAPLEKQEYDEKVKDIEDFIKSQETEDPMAQGIDENLQQGLLDKRNFKVKKKMKQEIYNWKSIIYNEYMSATYMVGRLAPDFAALMRIFNEIQKRDKNFTPKTVFDFGSGIGSGMWAVDTTWPNICLEALNVDSSENMNIMADRLLRGGDAEQTPYVRPGGNFFKQFLPSSEMLKYDLVLASRTLFELPDIESRLRTIDILWRKTGGYLVLVEAGTNEGYRLLLEARDYILEMSYKAKEFGGNHPEGHVFAPCPHDYFCPRYLDGSNTPCNFEVSYEPLRLPGLKLKPKMEKFSYVVLKRGVRQYEAAENSTNETWPRVIRETLARKKHVICRTCTKFGKLQEFTCTKKRHGKHLYQVSKNSAWGDLLPVDIPEPEQKSEAEDPNNFDSAPLEIDNNPISALELDIKQNTIIISAANESQDHQMTHTNDLNDISDKGSVEVFIKHDTSSNITIKEDTR